MTTSHRAAITVATYYAARGPASSDPVPRKTHINAYTLWFNPAWPGCIVYEIDARSGAEAKRIAVQQRLEHEMARWYGRQQAEEGAT